jgi:hypothetical protein
MCLELHADLGEIVAVSESLQSVVELILSTGRQKTKPPEIDAENGDLAAAEEAGAAQHGPIAPKGDQSIDCASVLDDLPFASDLGQPALERDR